MKPFADKAQVLGKVFLKPISNLPNHSQKKILKILDQEGIEKLDLNDWYDLKTILACFDQITNDFGPNTIFDFGKSIPENADFPEGVNSIENGLNLIDIAYNMNHQNGYVGFYKMVSHNLEEKQITMQCYNPYPCDFDRGLFTSMARKFKTGVKVVVDETKPTKKKGGNESWYIISYR